MARKKKKQEEEDNRIWTNMRIPMVTGFIATVTESEHSEIEMGETQDGDSKLTMPMYARYYDEYGDGDDPNKYFNFRCIFTGDTADTHYDNLEAGDKVFVETRGIYPKMTTNDEMQYINVEVAFPKLHYVWLQAWADNDDRDDEEEEEKPKRKAKPKRSRRTSKKADATKRKPRQNRSDDDDDDEEDEAPKKKRKRKGFFG